MRKLAHKGYFIGLVAAFLLLGFLSLTDFHHLRTPGPFNAGHEKLACEECHESATGSMRQQIQANLAYLAGQRSTVAAFNFEFPDNRDCLACHAREDDHHPVYRFNEPRFKEARKALKPQYCVSCHKEHTGVRVSSEAENCRHCHEEIKVKHDPLDISHADLIKLKDWGTCLACHDFHGNHVMKVATKVEDMLDAEEIKNYFAGGKDPYSEKKTEKSRKTRYEN